MITFKFDLEKQNEYYCLVKKKLNTNFYQDLHFYVLPFMPEKFRSRIIYLPETCDPELIYRKHKKEIENLETIWNRTKQEFITKLSRYFPNFSSIDILISPSLYGSMGSFKVKDDTVFIFPRYDRGIIGLQKLMIQSIVRFYNPDLRWEEIVDESTKIQNILFPNKKGLFKILDTQFVGGLAEESAKYLEKLKVPSKKIVDKPDNLTKSENIVFNLLLRNKNKLVTFDEIADWLWKDKSEEKFSEYAITKLIERLKKKLPKNMVHAQRSIGYLLHT